MKHDGEALEHFVAELLAHVDDDVSRVVVGIEMTADAVVEVLLERGVKVFGINPKQLDRFRDRHSVAGAKDDRRDAFVLADALRTDLRLFRRLELGDAKMITLRELSRARSETVDQVQALSNRLWQQVHRYFPQMLELGSFHTDPWLLDLFELASTPVLLKHLKRSKVEALLKKRRIRRIDADAVLTTLRKKALPVAPGVAEAASEHARMIVAVLRAAIAQREHADRRIEEVLSALEPAAPDDDVPRQTRDVDIVLSLPGVGPILAATLFTEATTALLQRDYATLRTRSGVAPVTSQASKGRSRRCVTRAISASERPYISGAASPFNTMSDSVPFTSAFAPRARATDARSVASETGHWRCSSPCSRTTRSTTLRAACPPPDPRPHARRPSSSRSYA